MHDLACKQGKVYLEESSDPPALEIRDVPLP
jgi:hypothetical protein